MKTTKIKGFVKTHAKKLIVGVIAGVISLVTFGLVKVFKKGEQEEAQ